MRWVDAGLAVTQLIVVSVSLLLAARLFGLPAEERDRFLDDNAIEPAWRAKLLLQLGAAVLLPLVLSGTLLARFRGHAAHWLTRLAARLGPLSLACFLPTLLNYRQWYTQPLPYLTLLLACVLVAERLFERAFTAGTPSPPLRRVEPLGPPLPATGRERWLPLAIVVLAAAAYSLHASHFTIVRHQLFQTAGFDLGIFDNLMFNAMHGFQFRSTIAVPGGSYLSNHAEYGMFLFVPLYALRPGPEFLLCLQSTMIGFAAVPLYVFASNFLPRTAAAALACAYLFYAPLHGPNYYDFHWMPVSMLFFFWLFHAIVRRQVLAITLLVPVICSIREDAALGLIAVGLFLILTRYWTKLGAILTCVAAAWFVLVKFVIMPWAGPWWFADIYKDLVAKGEGGYGSVVKTILINPNYFLKTLLNEPKFAFALHLLAPLGLLAVRHPALAVLMMPGFVVTLMTTGYAPTTSISFQYTTHWIPFLFGAVVIALALRAARKGRAAQSASVAALCFGVLCHSYVFGAIFQHNTFVGGFSKVDFEMTPNDRARYADLRAVTAKIPAQASVAAGELEVAHVSTRKDAFTLRDSAHEAEFLLLNRNRLDEHTRNNVRAAFHKSHYGLFAQKGDFYVLRKGHESPETEEAFKKLAFQRYRKTPEHRDSGSLVGPGGNCAAVDLARSRNVFVRDCAAEPKPRWTLALSEGRLRHRAQPDLCLGMPKRKNGEFLQVIGCSDPASAWSFQRIAIHGYSETCLDLLGGSTRAGAEIGVWDCLDNDNQRWHVSESGEIRWTGLGASKCLTVRSAQDGEAATLHDCDGSAGQKFSFSENKIRYADKCLDLRPQGNQDPKFSPVLPGNGWRMQLWPCDPAQWNQEFHLAGAIRHGSKCMDSRWGRVEDGSPVGAWDCVNNHTNQTWEVHF